MSIPIDLHFSESFNSGGIDTIYKKTPFALPPILISTSIARYPYKEDTITPFICLINGSSTILTYRGSCLIKMRCLLLYLIIFDKYPHLLKVSLHLDHLNGLSIPSTCGREVNRCGWCYENPIIVSSIFLWAIIESDFCYWFRYCHLLL